MAPNITSSTDSGEPAVRRMEHEDGSTIVVDFGAAAQEIHTDIVDETLLVVRERPGGDDDSYELELPTGQARTFMKNGVLTVEVRE